MNFKITPSKLKGKVKVPSSKSHTHRALLFALLAEGLSTIHNYLDSPDIDAMIAAIEAFGAKVKKKEESLEVFGVNGNLEPPVDIIDAKNSGIVLRFIGALSPLTSSYTVITGDHSIRTRRPLKPLLSALEELGAEAKSMRGDGYAPVIIKGPLTKGKCHLDGKDSQPVSALLVATSFREEKTVIHVKDPGEKPWIDMTLNWLDLMNLPYKNHDYEMYEIPGGGHIKAFEYNVPGDFSSLAFPVAAALVTDSEICIDNVDLTDVQGDKKLLDAFKKMGANLLMEGTTLNVKKGSPLKGATFDINDYIDSITILAVVGCYASGETVITNAQIAREKECDRITAIRAELKKMGADIEEKEDGLIVRSSKLKGAPLHSYHDHRMVMSLCVAALGAEGASTIQDIECVAKTYPNFKQHMVSLGANIE